MDVYNGLTNAVHTKQTKMLPLFIFLLVKAVTKTSKKRKRGVYIYINKKSFNQSVFAHYYTESLR